MASDRRLSIQHEMPVPRVYATLSPDYENTVMIVGFELSSRWGEPVLRVEVEIPWRRPRPWRLDVTLPEKQRSYREFEWVPCG